MNDKDFRSLIGSLGGDTCFLPHWMKLRSYLEFYNAEGREYLDPELRNASQAFLKELGNLELFILEHFFTDYSARGERILGMHPEMKNGHSGDEDASKYLRYQVELYSILDSMLERHHRYASAAKSRLGPQRKQPTVP